MNLSTRPLVALLVHAPEDALEERPHEVDELLELGRRLGRRRSHDGQVNVTIPGGDDLVALHVVQLRGHVPCTRGSGGEDHGGLRTLLDDGTLDVVQSCREDDVAHDDVVGVVQVQLQVDGGTDVVAVVGVEQGRVGEVEHGALHRSGLRDVVGDDELRLLHGGERVVLGVGGRRGGGAEHREHDGQQADTHDLTHGMGNAFLVGYLGHICS